MKLLLPILLFLAGAIYAAESGDEVIVVYNSSLPESKAVADYYAARRHVPAAQVFGFELTTNELMTRSEFRDHLEKPLAKALESKKLWHIGADIGPVTNAHSGKLIWKVVRTKIRYAVLCYGVPVHIDEDPNLNEPIAENVRPELRRNEAAVDSDLALLPAIEQDLPLAGPLGNRFYTLTNSALLNPTNGILMVTRLDGPSADIARGLVDKAIEAESNGLNGRAYFDARNLSTNSPYILGDDWILGAAKFCQYIMGYETVVDRNPATFPADFPMSQIAIYCGWYDEHASGPFARKTVEFMPGAFGYHLHSLSASVVRSTTERWVGPMLARGATATMGCVAEPYVGGTPDVSVFCARWMMRQFTFGEAAYACQPMLSWQTTVIGDPLYCPFCKQLPERLAEQEMTTNKWIEWSYLRLVNLNLLRGKSPEQIANFLQALPVTKQSAVLTEKLGDLFATEGKPSSTIEAYTDALKRGPSPMQAVRIRLELADRLIAAGRPKDAQANLKAIIQDNPEYPGNEDVSRRIVGFENSAGTNGTTVGLPQRTNQ